MTTETTEWTDDTIEQKNAMFNIRLRKKAYIKLSKLELKTFANVDYVFEDQLKHKLGRVYTELMSDITKNQLDLIRNQLVHLTKLLYEDIKNTDVSLKEDIYEDIKNTDFSVLTFQ